MSRDRHSEPLTDPGVVPDPFEDRRVMLHGLPAKERLSEIDAELPALARNPAAAETFHRKKLMRMRDEARLEAGLVSAAQLQIENSPFSRMEFAQAQIAWKPRRDATA